MRIVSQDGCYDIPYDQAFLNRIGTTISAKTNTGDLILLAQYQNEEKAIRAMEMCREKYLSRMELDGGYDMVHGCYVQPNYWVLPKVFSFPKDEEVE